MLFEFLSSVVTTINFQASKRVTVSAQQILDNVFIGFNVVDGDMGFLTRQHRSDQKYIVTQDGKVLMVAVLKPVLDSIKDLGDRIEYLYKFGVGTGKDFEGENNTALGAVLLLSFSKDPNIQNDYFNPSEGTTSCTFIGGTFGGDEGQSYILLDSDIQGIQSGYTSCQFQVQLDTANKNMVEKNLQIHVLDRACNLLFVIDEEHNTRCHLRYLETGFQVMCMIKPDKLIAYSGEVITYAIGDPKTDAKITVTEDDV